MRLLIIMALVILCTLAGWHYYPQLYKAITDKEAPVKMVEPEAPAAPADSAGETAAG